ncbi:hypothetical protein [Thalassomonas sp. RHCl1]|nr:hypothetical protein [Thalassomonas sp. RHCl1]
MTIPQNKLNEVKTAASAAMARSKARQAQITANVHQIKAKQVTNRPRP